MKFFLLFIFAFSALFAETGIVKVEDYFQNSGLQYNWAIDALKKHSWRGDERILDVGCGDGKISAWIGETCVPRGSVLGVDLSSSMIDFALAHSLRPNVQFLQKDALALPFEEAFDVAVSFCALHWIVDQETALRKIYQSLAPEGEVLFVNVGEWKGNLGPITFAIATSEKWMSYFPNFKPTRIHFSAREYHSLLEKCGFELLSLEEEVSTTLFPHRDAFVKWLSPLITEVEFLPFELRGPFLQEVAEEILRVNRAPLEGEIPIQYVKLKVFARKR